MKATLTRVALLKGLAHVQSVVEKRNTIPILANVMLTVRDGKLTLTATDMEIAVVEDVETTDSIAGACTAPAALLYDIIRKLPSDSEIILTLGDGETPQLRLRSGRYATSLVALPVDDYPAMTSGALGHKFVCPAAGLRHLIDRTRFAISTEETRYYLNGIYLHAAETDGTKVLRAVATDGHRLARVEEPLPEGADGMPGVIVPRKTIGELRKLIDEVTDDVEIALSDTRIQFKVGAVTLTSKLVDGTFPEYDRVIPRDNDRVLRVGKKDFADAVARVSAISSDRSRPVKLSLKKNLLVLSAASPDQGTATEELEGERVKYDAGPLEISFQARYLNDITDQIADEVEFRFADESAPAIMSDTADKSSIYVIMPIRF